MYEMVMCTYLPNVDNSLLAQRLGRPGHRKAIDTTGRLLLYSRRSGLTVYLILRVGKSPVCTALSTL